MNMELLKDMELIKIENGLTTLDPTASAELKLIADIIKKLKRRDEEIKKAILEEMENKNILKIDTDKVSISYIASSDRETFDTKNFREKHSDLYDEFVKFTPVKSSIRVKVKE
jgi:hypothetical protein